MLDLDVFIKGIEELCAHFTDWGMDSKNPKAIDVWYDFFKLETNESFKNMVNKYIANETMYPTIAGLLECKINSNRLN